MIREIVLDSLLKASVVGISVAVGMIVITALIQSFLKDLEAYLDKKNNKRD